MNLLAPFSFRLPLGIVSILSLGVDPVCSDVHKPSRRPGSESISDNFGTSWPANSTAYRRELRKRMGGRNSRCGPAGDASTATHGLSSTL